ncbi:hypothetical protein GALL_353250 [mine drainage metagenome]|uniref:Uncharacterized protein n=1 Tax=mine drainage metagenome TaxID=410659 RepID=A0A1J5QH73_9ZZZZ
MAFACTDAGAQGKRGQSQRTFDPWRIGFNPISAALASDRARAGYGGLSRGPSWTSIEEVEIANGAQKGPVPLGRP